MKYSDVISRIRNITRSWINDIYDDGKVPHVDDIDEADIVKLASDITFDLWSSDLNIEPDGTPKGR